MWTELHNCEIIENKLPSCRWFDSHDLQARNHWQWILRPTEWSQIFFSIDINKCKRLSQTCGVFLRSRMMWNEKSNWIETMAEFNNLFKSCELKKKYLFNQCYRIQLSVSLCAPAHVTAKVVHLSDNSFHRVIFIANNKWSMTVDFTLRRGFHKSNSAGGNGIASATSFCRANHNLCPYIE